MKKLTLMMTLVVVFSHGATSWASLSGTLYSNGDNGYSATDTSGGLVAINALEGSLTWTVSQLSNGLWDYNYLYTPATANKSQGVGAISVQFGQQPTDLTWAYTYTGTATGMGTATTSGNVQTINRTYAGNSTYNSWLNASNPSGSNVNVTTTFQGMQWTINATPKGSNSLDLNLETSLAPEWGNIYMDGYNTTVNNGYALVRNTNYDTPASQAFSINGPILAGYVPTPGTESPTPIPPSMLLFASGLFGFVFIKRKDYKAY